MAYCTYSGRFGNVLHSIAATYAQSRRLNEICYLKSFSQFDKFPNLRQLTKLIPSLPQKPVYYEGRQASWPDPVRLPPQTKNLVLQGCWESDQFFDDFADDIRLLYDVETDETNATALHIRRKDFVRPTDHHVLLDLSWYWRALCLLNPERVIIFSDDISWCRKSLNWPNAEFSTVKDAFEDWRKMRGCKDFIISNSTYSWWAAYLSNSKHVICPKKWLRYDDETYRYLTNWTILEN